ncbi:MAG: hypothetical protein BWY15_00311 [Firmicutes bacterium ADurb.Bin193]|nr:MAG: hypothetical protein BWY15_00311 [Firmicutes bacterium ADurb.Bin193]
MKSLAKPVALFQVAVMLIVCILPQTVPVKADSGPMIGQVMVDPENPSWLVRKTATGYDPVFICGPGDPEEFLYIGTRQSDGTRTGGNQQEIIDRIKDSGANCIYFQAIRGTINKPAQGDGDNTMNPFVDSDITKGLSEPILAQWEGWFDQLDANGTIMYFFFYDDGIYPWGNKTDTTVSAAEKAFFETIVNRFKKYKNLIWVIAEESPEGFTDAKISALAKIIADADEYDHVIANHYRRFDTFPLPNDPYIDQFAIQYHGGTSPQDEKNSSPSDPNTGANYNKRDSSEINEKANREWRNAAGRYNLNIVECKIMQGAWIAAASAEKAGNTALANQNWAKLRKCYWAAGMGGAYSMVLRMFFTESHSEWVLTDGTPITDTPQHVVEACGHVVNFFEATDFNKMSPNNSLASGSTHYVMENPQNSYIAYSHTYSGSMGVKNMRAGTYDLKWFDCASGTWVNQDNVTLTEGTNSFTKPAGITGSEVALYIKHQNYIVGEPTPTPKTYEVETTNYRFGEVDGVVSMEAEHYSKAYMYEKVDATSVQDTLVFKGIERAVSAGFNPGFNNKNSLINSANYSGGMAMQPAALPPTNHTVPEQCDHSDDAGECQQCNDFWAGPNNAGGYLEYKFTVTTPGTWFVWIRTNGINSANNGLDIYLDGARFTPNLNFHHPTERENGQFKPVTLNNGQLPGIDGLYIAKGGWDWRTEWSFTGNREVHNGGPVYLQNLAAGKEYTLKITKRKSDFPLIDKIVLTHGADTLTKTQIDNMWQSNVPVSGMGSAETQVGYAPVANDKTFKFPQNAPRTQIDFVDYTSGSGDLEEIEVIKRPSHGTFEYSEGNNEASYTPDPGFVGIDTFTWRVFDGVNYSNIATVTLNVGVVVIESMKASNGTLTEMVVKNDNPYPITADIILAFYNENDILIGMKVLRENILAANLNANILSEAVDVGDAKKVRVFIWDSFSTLKPIARVVSCNVSDLLIQEGSLWMNTAKGISNVTIADEPFDVGVPMYNMGASVSTTAFAETVPDILKGGVLIRTDNETNAVKAKYYPANLGSETAIKFTVTQAVTVYLAVPYKNPQGVVNVNHSSMPTWMSSNGWAAVNAGDDTMTGNGGAAYKLYYKTFDADTEVSLGCTFPPDGSKTPSTYIVIVKPHN